MPKVSVIIPVYGVESFIEQCARSLFEQTLDDMEFLFIDDCSPDKSIDILKSIIGEYPSRKYQVKIHRMEHNSGQALVRKWGMQNATGDYVIHCDSDDWVDLDLYEKLYCTATKEIADIVYYDFYRSDGVNHVSYHRLVEPFENKYDIIKQLLSGRLTGSVCGAMFNRSLYQVNFSYPKANMGEDLAMMLQMVYNSHRNITYLPQPMYYYRENTSSISKAKSESSIMRRFNDNIVNGNQMFDFLTRVGLSEDMEEEIEIYKFMVRKNLLPLLGGKGYYKKWKKCYPEINKHFLWNRQASTKDKLLFVTCFLGCYHILSKFR